MSETDADALARIHRALPRLACTSAERIDGGWASDSYRVVGRVLDREGGDDGTWIVQIGRPPHEDDLRRQIAILPELLAEVSAPIPEPEYADPTVPAMAYRQIPGRSCSERADLGLWPERLGRFLYDLHAVPPEFVSLRARSSADVRAQVRAELERARGESFPLLAVHERAALDRTWSVFTDDDALWRLAPCLVHGDLGLQHVLVDERGDLSGVIDWSDVEVGDPAWDFAIVLHDLPDQGARALAAYGGAPDAGFLTRAAFGWAFVPFHEVRRGLGTEQTDLVERGIAGIRERADW
jgi:aminoglycoside phosphotransferase (APT) family kinase protein